LESLVAVVILAVGLTAVIRALMTTAQAGQAVLDYRCAALLAENALFDVMRQGGDLSDLKNETLKRDANGFSSRWDIKGPCRDNAPASLRAARLNISWQTGRRTQQVSFDTCLFLKEGKDEDVK